jgi:glucosamine kinase
LAKKQEMLLIADSGATKTEWLIRDSGKWRDTILTMGYNPWHQSDKQLDQSISALKMQLDFSAVERLVFYGAGCGAAVNRQKVAEVLKRFFPETTIEVNHDLLAAAHALFGNTAGIACILGTGSNACVYDGQAVILQIPSLGYILGDEGSGAIIGKMICQAYFRNQLPENLAADFYSVYQLQLPEFLENVYKKPASAAYLADFTRFAWRHKENAFIQALLADAFDGFIDKQIGYFQQIKPLTIGFTGSVAFHFAKLLQERLDINGYKAGKILKSPAKGLMQYYDKL